MAEMYKLHSGTFDGQLHPGKWTAGTWKSPVWKGKSSSKPWFLGSMFIFTGAVYSNYSNIYIHKYNPLIRAIYCDIAKITSGLKKLQGRCLSDLSAIVHHSTVLCARYCINMLPPWIPHSFFEFLRCFDLLRTSRHVVYNETEETRDVMMNAKV